MDSYAFSIYHDYDEEGMIDGGEIETEEEEEEYDENSGIVLYVYNSIGNN